MDFMSLLMPYTVFLAIISFVLILLGLRRHVPEGISKNRYRPRTLVIVPCKGMDVTLEKNLRSLKGQDYRNYDVVAVVDTMQDLALPTIEKVGIRNLVSSQRFVDGSGKVNAISTALNACKGYEVYVIVDSDVCVGKSWLRLLVEPLGDSNVGLSTTFPQFRPIGGQWSKIKYVWGLVGIGLMEDRKTRFGWGGSLAFRKDLISGKREFAFFSRSLSDDIALTRLARVRGLDIFYSKDAEPIVNTDDGFGPFVEWANRQTALAVRGDPKIFYFGMVYYGMQIVLILSALFLSAYYTPIYLVFLVPALLRIYKDYDRARWKMPAIALIDFFMPFLLFYNLLVGKTTKSITWRGRRYPLSSISLNAPR